MNTRAVEKITERMLELIREPELIDAYELRIVATRINALAEMI